MADHVLSGLDAKRAELEAELRQTEQLIDQYIEKLQEGEIQSTVVWSFTNTTSPENPLGRHASDAHWTTATL